MKITFDNPDKVTGRLTLVVEEADYEKDVDKTLKTYRKRASVPGFRPGMVPMGMIKRQYGAAAKMDAINHIMGEQLSKYITDNKIGMLGEPLPAESQEQIDLEAPAPYTFAFDIAIAPKFEITLTSEDTIDYNNVVVDDKVVDDRIQAYASRGGHYDKVDEYQQGDMLKGDLSELDSDGNVKEEGIRVEGAVMMPEYIKIDEQKALFVGAKKDSAITFNPKKAYPESDVEIASLLRKKKEEVADIDSDFSYQITEISRYTPAAVNQELFDSVLGKDAVKSEEEFKAKIAEQIKEEYVSMTDFRFLQDVRKYCEEKVGELTFPEELLKKIMIAKNKDKGADYVEKNFEASIKELKWHLIKEQLTKAHEIKVGEQDVMATAKEMARMQFAQYGMNNVPEEYIDNYAKEMLGKEEYIEGLVDRTMDQKLMQKLKTIVTLNEKQVTVDEFNK